MFLELSDVNWDQNQACETLMYLMADAPKLKTLFYKNQIGERKITIEHTPAILNEDQEVQSGNEGTIIFKDSTTDAVICQKNTIFGSKIKLISKDEEEDQANTDAANADENNEQLDQVDDAEEESKQ